MAEAERHTEFVVHGVSLRVPEDLLTPAIRAALSSQKYEHLEVRQVVRFVRPGDRLLEFGGGLGFLSAVAWRTAPLEHCAVVEADPRLLPVITDTHLRNGVRSEVVHAAALSPTSEAWRLLDGCGTVPFHVSANFWGSSLRAKAGAVREVRVPAAETGALLARQRPTVLVVDIEGGEADMFEGVDLTGVRRVFIELHKGVIGLRGIARLNAILAAQGLVYDPDFSVGATVMYAREDA